MHSAVCNSRFKTFLKDGGYDSRAIIKSSPLPDDLRSGLQVCDEMLRSGKGRSVTPATDTVSHSPASGGADVPQRTAPQTSPLVAVRLRERYKRHRSEPGVNTVMDVAILPRKNRIDATVDSLIEAERRVNNRQYIAVHSYHLHIQPKDEETQIHLLIRNPAAHLWPEKILDFSLDGNPVLTLNLETLIRKASQETARVLLYFCDLCYHKDQADTPTTDLPLEMKEMLMLWEDVVHFISILRSRESQFRTEASASAILSRDSASTLPSAHTQMDTYD